MAVKDMFLLQVQTLSRRLREENGMGGLEKQWLHFNRTCKQAEIQLSGSSDNHSSLLLGVVLYFPFEQSDSFSFPF